MIEKRRSGGTSVGVCHSSKMTREAMIALLGEAKLKINCPVCNKPLFQLYGEDDSPGLGTIITNKCSHCGHIIGVNSKSGDAIEISTNTKK